VPCISGNGRKRWGKPVTKRSKNTGKKSASSAGNGKNYGGVLGHHSGGDGVKKILSGNTEWGAGGIRFGFKRLVSRTTQGQTPGIWRSRKRNKGETNHIAGG